MMKIKHLNKKMLLISLCVFLGISSKSVGQENLNNRIIIQIKEGSSLVIPESIGIKSAKIAYPEKFKHKELAKDLGLDRFYTLEINSTLNIQQVLFYLRSLSIYERVEIDSKGTVADTIPNDPEFPNQWGLRNTGQIGIAGYDIKAYRAWDMIDPNSINVITVAIVDSGVQFEHPDLEGIVLPGWVVNPAFTYFDHCAHGTHVAGIVGALINNGIGVAGINPNVKILPVKVLDGCWGLESWCADGIIWATDNGADICNMSLQYSDGSEYFRLACIYARTQGVILVAAMGNSANPNAWWPARFEECWGISSIAPDGTLSLFSNYGETDFAAPGESIISTVSVYAYLYYSGTSMASPHVAGIFSLMLSIDPLQTPEELYTKLAESSVDLGTPGYDIYFGHGLPDAANAARKSLRCYPDANGDGLLNIADFGAFQTKFAIGNWYADCNGDQILNLADFGCFMTKFALGCN
mgnify:CR=1 FL=1